VISSAVEHCLHTAGVTCSIHVSPTNLRLLIFFGFFAR
jgi:hypothetical protein